MFEIWLEAANVGYPAKYRLQPSDRRHVAGVGRKLGGVSWYMKSLTQSRKKKKKKSWATEVDFYFIQERSDQIKGTNIKTTKLAENYTLKFQTCSKPDSGILQDDASEMEISIGT